MSELNAAKSNLVIASLCDEFKKHNHIPTEAYSRLNVCRGLGTEGIYRHKKYDKANGDRHLKTIWV